MLSTDWKRSGSSGPAHWVKLAGSRFFTTACLTTISRELAINVPTVKIGLAMRPGITYSIPADGEICPQCREKAIQQA